MPIADPHRAEPTTRRWLISLAVAILMHAIALVTLDLLRPFDASPVRAAAQPLELVFTPAEPAPTSDPSRDAEPSYFTELPEDRSDERAERPDALSNVDSRARDEVAGLTASELPRLTGEGQAPAVAIERSPTTPEIPPAAGESGEDFESRPEAEAGSATDESANPEKDGNLAAGEGAGADGLAQRMAGDPRTDLEQGSPRPVEETSLFRIEGSGNSEITQEAMANPTGNAPLFGAISLNTMAWDYAPWMQRFTRDFHRNWRPPFAYMMGIIHGEHRVRIEIAKDGRILSMEVLEEEGHVSLAQASLANLQGIAPLSPLPERFPEDTLILHLTITYQQWKKPR